MGRIRVFMLLDNPLTGDLRVQREARALVEEGFKVRIYCLKKAELPSIETRDHIEIRRWFDERVFDVKKPLYLSRMVREIRKDMKVGKNEHVILHCHDQTMLHVGVKLKKRIKKARIIYDSHEMFHAWPLNFGITGKPFLFIKSYLIRKWQIRRERRNGRKINYLITVSDSISSILKKYFKIKDPVLTVRNIPEFQMIPVRPDYFRKKFRIPSGDTVAVFIAGNIYIKSQNLKQVIDQLGNKDNTAFVIISGTGFGRNYFENYVRSNGFHNIYFHDRVPPAEMIDYLAGCDVGILPFWNKKDLSYWYALPNKLFEYIMAEIPILSTAQPEFRLIIEKYNTGICIDPDTPEAFSRGMETIMAHKQTYLPYIKEAKRFLNWENEKIKLIGLYRSIEMNYAREQV